MAKLVDALDLGSNVSRCAGSSPVRRTKKTRAFFCFGLLLVKGQRAKVKGQRSKVKRLMAERIGINGSL